MYCISNDIPRRAVRRLWQSGSVLALIALLLPGCSAPGYDSRTSEVAIFVTEDGFRPRESFAPRDVPATLVVTRLTDRTCAKDIMIDGMDSTWTLPLNQQVRIELPKGIHDTLSFQCGMEMYHGLVIAK